VFGLQALWSLLDFEFNRLPFVECFVPLGLNRREVDENVLTGLALDEPIALGRIEPLDSALLFCH